MRRILPLSLAVAATAWIGTEARAGVIQFQLNGVTLADGGSATGTFNIDDATGVVSGASIIVTDSNFSGSPDVFNNSNVSSEFDANGLTFDIYNCNGGPCNGFALTFNHPVSMAPDGIALGSGSFYSYNGQSATTFVTGGEIDPVVPEPTSLSLMLGGAILMAGAVRYRRRGQAILTQSSYSELR